MMHWTDLISTKRFGLEDRYISDSPNRTEFQRDYDRIIFSAPFRRLQNKTQVFPLPGSVFVHNRLTHSLEVASVGRSLGNSIATQLLQREELKDSPLIGELGAIVSAACLAHDLGNPPFGHSGEKAISTYFTEGEGRAIQNMVSKKVWLDLTHYEGNANALRLLTHQFNGRREGGFALTYSTLASIVKYPFESSEAGNKSKFGFFDSEKESYLRIAKDLKIKCLSDNPIIYARHPLVYLVEAADDICYQLMDLEDAHKLKIISKEETLNLLEGFLEEKQLVKAKEVLHVVTDTNEQIAYLRSIIIGKLITECGETFMKYESDILNGTFTGDLISHLPNKTVIAYKRCKSVAIHKIYKSSHVVDIEISGYKIIRTLLDLYINAVCAPDKAYSQLLTNRVSSQYNTHSPNIEERIMAVLDFISGMTDIYALDLYHKINGNSIPTA